MKSYINKLDPRSQPDSQHSPKLIRSRDRDQVQNLIRNIHFLLIAGALILTGCVGPVALHKAVLEYDDTIQRLESEILLLNIARLHNNHSVPNTFWDRDAFIILYKLFQVTVTDVSAVGIPVTIAK